MEVFIMKYDRVLVYTKRGNLLGYLNTDKVLKENANYATSSVKAYYEKEREIQLIASVRWENFPVPTRNGIVQMPKCFCRIKCPVNPLPVKGEFELPSIESLREFLKANGWTLKQDIYSGWFK
jgi:hypothetical protein